MSNNLKNIIKRILNESDDMQWMMDIDIPQVGDTYKYLVQKELEPFKSYFFVITNIIPTPWTQSKYVIKYRIQGNTEKYDYEIYLDDFLTAVEGGRFVKIKEINESDDMQWIKDIPAGIEIGACYKYLNVITQSHLERLRLVNQPLVIEKIIAHVPSSGHEHPKYYYDKEVSSIEELTIADYEKAWVYLRNQETGYRNFLGVTEMVNKLEDGDLIPC